MDSEYVVEVEVQGFAVEGMKAVDGSLLTAKQAKQANADKLASFDDVELVDLTNALVRDDGSGILTFRWDPPAEDADEHAAETWMAAKGYTAHALSAVAGAGFLRVEHRIAVRDVEGSVEADDPE